MLKMVLCASTSTADASASRDCCCCCSCSCHQVTARVAASRSTCAPYGVEPKSPGGAPSGSLGVHVTAEGGCNPSSHDSSGTEDSAAPECVPRLCKSCREGKEAGCKKKRSCRCSHCCCCSCTVLPTSHITSIVKAHRFLSYMPMIDEDKEEAIADALAQSGYPGSFAWSKDVSPCGYARLCRAGFLTIADSFEHPNRSSSPGITILFLPKLHTERMCLLLNTPTGALPASKNLRRKARHFLLSVDKAFDEVLAGCVRRHGENWLWHPVRQCLRALHRRTLRDAALRHQQESDSSPFVEKAENISRLPSAQQQQVGSVCPGDVELHSFEVWAPLTAINDIKLLPLTRGRGKEGSSFIESTEEATAARADPKVSEILVSLGASPFVGKESASYKGLCLVAGEIGVSVGTVYTSLTAFTDADSAGTAQLTVTRLLLRKAGYDLLDLGMQLPYKESLGAQLFPRAVFLKLFRKLRDRQASPLEATMQLCCKTAEACFKQEGPQKGRSPRLPNVLDGGEKFLGHKAAIEQNTCCPPSAAAEGSSWSLPAGFVGCRELMQLLAESREK